MKKTLTVNLGGTVFHIDEDAYQLLDKYLSNLRIHFRKEEGSDEIMDDFEMRISELLNERVRLGYGSPDKPGGLSIQLCKSEKKEFYIRYSS